MKNKNQTQTGEGNAPRVTMTDEQMVNLLKIGLETDLDQTFRYWRTITRDYEPEQKYGTNEDFKEHIKHGGMRDDY